MSVIVPGRIADGVLLALFCGLITVLTYLAAKGRKFVLRKTLPAVVAIPEAIGRAVEMGRPVHYTPGGNPLSGVRGTQIQMGLVIMGHAARAAARLGARFIVSLSNPDQIGLSNEIYRSAFTAEGHPEVEPDVRYYSSGDAPFGAGTIGTLAREHCAVNMIIGGSGSDFPIIAEGAYRIGAFQIGGCGNIFMIPMVVAACDYTLIGDELFAAGAMLSGESVQTAGIVANDISKVITVAIIIVGAILLSAGIPLVANLLKM